jgi:hypothetical protein
LVDDPPASNQIATSCGLVAGALVGRGALDVTATVESIVPELKATSFRGATVQRHAEAPLHLTPGNRLLISSPGESAR